MPVTVSCPSCGRKLNAPDILAGRKVKCPKCSSIFLVKARSKSQTPALAKEEGFTSTAPAALPAGKRQPVVDGFVLVDDDQSEDGHGIQVADVGLIPASGSKVPLGLGISSLALGIIAFVLSLVPFVRSGQPILSIVSLPLSGLGLLLGLGGLAVSIMQKGRALGLPIAGSACSLVALAMGVVWLGWLQPGKSVPIAAVDVKPGSALAEPISPDPSEKETSPKSKQPNADARNWIDASKGPIAYGDVRVKVGEVMVGTLKTKDILGDQQTPTNYLRIQILIGNAGKSKKIDYRSWSGATSPDGLTDMLKGLGRDGGVGDVLALGGKNAASVTDNHGNTYKRFKVELGAEILGQIRGDTSIYPDSTIEDLLIFEPPVENLEYLHLELPAAAVGGMGSLYLKIPKKMIRR